MTKQNHNWTRHTKNVTNRYHILVCAHLGYDGHLEVMITTDARSGLWQSNETRTSKFRDWHKPDHSNAITHAKYIELAVLIVFAPKVGKCNQLSDQKPVITRQSFPRDKDKPPMTTNWTHHLLTPSVYQTGWELCACTSHTFQLSWHLTRWCTRSASHSHASSHSYPQTVALVAA